VILDEVHERDIDTDFILLALMHVLRNYPDIRVVLMSATIDNNLFRQYFANDHIDRFLNKENFYVQKMAKAKPRNK
jgi:HrpA-like RNA helicase